MNALIQFFILVWLLCSSFLLLAQNRPYPIVADFTEYPLGNYRSILLEPDNLWIGNDSGLLRVKGKYTEQFGKSNSPFTSRVNDVVKDEKGYIWSSTNTDGVVRFDPVTKAFEQFTHSNGLTSDRCDFFVLVDTEVFVTCNNGLYSISNVLNEVTHHLQEEGLFKNYDTAFNTLAADKLGNLWLVADDDLLYRYEYKTGEVVQIDTGNIKFVDKTVLFSDSKDRLWISAENTVYKLQKQDGGYTFETVESEAPNNSFYTIIEDAQGQVLFGGSKLLIYKEDESRLAYTNAYQPFFQESETIDYIIDLAVGTDDNVYALSGQQIALLPNIKDALRYLAFDEEPNEYITSIFPLNDDELFINVGHNLYVYHMKTQSLRLIVDVEHDVEEVDKLNESQLILISPTTELSVLDIEKSTLQHFDKVSLGLPSDLTSSGGASIGALIVDSNEQVYLGTLGANAGIYQGNLKDGFRNVYPNVRAYDALKSNDGSLYFIILHQGLLEFTADKQWKLWPLPEGKRMSYPTCFLEDARGLIWFCDNDNGAGYFDKKSQRISFLDPIYTGGTSHVKKMIAEGDYLWVTSDRGVYRYDHSNLASISMGREHGIVETNFPDTVTYKISGEELLIGGARYDYVLNIEQINAFLNKRAKQTTIPHIVNLKVSTRDSAQSQDRSVQLYKAIELEETLTASYNDFLFTFRFAINNFIERDSYRFEYRLLGLNDRWLLAEQDAATFSTLSAGDYILEVRTIDFRSSAEQPVVHLPIRVLPPYWLTIQAYVFYAFLLILSFYLIYRYRVRQLEQANAQLEAAVVGRTQELTERSSELSKSNEQISMLLAQKESLFANVSHEFRTPLTLMLGPMLELRTKLSNEYDLRKFDMVHRNTQRLAQLVEQILELAHLDTAAESPKQVYDIDNALGILVNAFKPLAELKRQTLVFSNQCSGGLSLTQDGLEKILYNLLSNAIKYSPEDTIISVSGVQVNNDYKLSIQDTGVGIPEDELENIFKRFTRLEKTADQLGSGLGLAVVKELVKANNGTIEVNSTLHQGTTFVVTFPLLSDFDASRTLPLSNTLSALDYASEWVPKTEEQNSLPTIDNNRQETGIKPVLLIIEDNADMRNYIQQSLQDDYVCMTANNGLQGIEMAIEHVPDMILSDLMMPLKGGFEVVDALRSNELTAHVPITLLTAKGDDKSRLTGWQKSVDDYIAKPFNVEELKLRLSRLLSVRDLVKKRVTQQIDKQIIVDNELVKSAEDEGIFEQNKGVLSFDSKRDEEFYSKLMKVIEKNHADTQFGRGQAADELAVSERQLNRKLGAIVEYNFAELVRKYRLERAKELLLNGYQVGEVAHNVGFTSPSYFTHCFKASYGVTPKQVFNSNKESNFR